MKLTEKDRRILATSHLQADLSLRELSRICGLSERSVRYTLEKLTESGALTEIAYIDPYALGYRFYVIYISLLSHRPEIYSNFLLYLERCPIVGFLATVGGDYQFKVGVLVRSSNEVVEFQDELYDQFRSEIRSKSVIEVVNGSHFPMKFLDPTSPHRELSFGRASPAAEMDDFDHELLRTLARMRSTRTSVLARELGARETTVSYRMQRLKERRILLGAKYIVNLSKFGIHSFFHQVTLKGGGAAVRRQIFRYFLDHPNVFYVAASIGAWDIDVETGAEDPSDIIRFTQEFSNKFEGMVDALSMCPLFEFRKINYYPFGVRRVPVRPD